MTSNSTSHPRRRALTAGIASLACGAGVIAAARTAGKTPVGIPSTRLFSLTLTDSAGTAQPLQRWAGKPLVLNFWATWCRPCVDEMPELQALREAYAVRGVEVLGLAIDSPKAVAEFGAKLGVKYPLLIASAVGTDLSRDFGNPSGGLPFTVVLDAGGRVVGKKLGRIQSPELRRIVDSTLTA